MTRRPGKRGDRAHENQRSSEEGARHPEPPARETPEGGTDAAPGDPPDETVHGEGDRGLDGFK